jgi:hypothetical protein
MRDMPVFEWDEKKNAWLKETRDISFEEIVLAIENDNLLDTLPHPNQVKYPHQHIYIVAIREYIYCVPFVRKDTRTLFLKTVYPSRIAKQRYQSKKSEL